MKPLINAAMKRGYFITVEGPDGAGKTTQLPHIANWLRERDITVLETREPGGTPLGEALRGLLLHGTEEPIVADAELLLIFAARAQHLQQRILPALKQGTWVLCDRFTDASYAYQGGGRGLGTARVQALEAWLQGDFRPDLTLLLDVPVTVSTQRARTRGQLDRFELETIHLRQVIREAYLQQATVYPERIITIDASRTAEQVQQAIACNLQVFYEHRKQ